VTGGERYANAFMGGPETKRVAYETARLRLARYRVEGEQTRARAAAHAAQVSAEALGVERVGVWLLRDHARRLLCVSQYIRSRREHSAGQSLACDLYPAYVEALTTRRIIAADDARTHPSTRELDATYLQPNGISSMLDAPIIRAGRVIGVVCHEHVGPPRAWQQNELEFASSVADMVTLIFEQAERLELEAALQDQAEQRQESEKMEALGRMAGAVAHDFNNLLGAVYLYTDAVAPHLPAQFRGMASEVTTMLEVGKRLTQQLLAFGKERASDGPLGSVDLHAAIEHVLPIVRTGIGRGIELELRLLPSGARVCGETSQLEQIVLNLCLNARDAIAGNGEITVVTREPTPADDVAPDCIVLEVRDSGTGMDEATRSRIFEPFFTTKHGGSGLGLATVYGIVRRCGGSVRAISDIGAGTTMLIALPRPQTS
jgi:two-component system cell cycle sensor histidine kinase/response regulator CckA